MSTLASWSRGAALVGIATLFAAGPASAAELDATATCAFGQLGTQAIAVTIAVPDDLHSLDSAPPQKLTRFAYPTALTAGGRTVEFVDGSYLSTKIQPPTGAPYYSGLLFRGKQLPITGTIDSGFSTFVPEGFWKATIDDLRLNVRVTDASGEPVVTGGQDGDSDGNATTVDVRCAVKANPGILFFVAPKEGDDRTAPTDPSAFSATTSPTTARIRWKASTDDVGVRNYEYSLDPVGAEDAPGRSGFTSDADLTFTGLEPDTEYEFGARAYDSYPNRSARTSFTFRTPKRSTTTNLKRFDALGSGLAIAVESTLTGGAPRKACVIRQPSVIFAGQGLSGTAAVQGLWQNRYGVPQTLPGTRTGIVSLRDGATVPLAGLLGLTGNALINRSAFGTLGTLSLTGTYTARRTLAGFPVALPALLPLRQVTFRFVERAAGTCDGWPDQLRLTS